MAQDEVHGDVVAAGAGAIRDRLVAQPQALGGQDGDGRGRLALPGEDVEDDVGRMNALAQGLGTGRLSAARLVQRSERRSEGYEASRDSLSGTSGLLRRPRLRRLRRPVSCTSCQQCDVLTHGVTRLRGM